MAGKAVKNRAEVARCGLVEKAAELTGYRHLLAIFFFAGQAGFQIEMARRVEMDWLRGLMTLQEQA